MRDYFAPIANIGTELESMPKQKRRLIKKALELSKLYNLEVYLCVMDRSR